MAEEFKKNQQEVKNEIRKGIVGRLLGISAYRKCRNADKVKLREL